MIRRKGPVIKSLESVLRPEGSLWWERFVKEVGLEPRVKEIEGVLDVESGGGQLCVTRMMLVIERGYAVCEIGDFRPV